MRGDGPAARGLPDDASMGVRVLSDDWGPDGHSHSWYALEEALPIFMETYHPFEANKLLSDDPHVACWQMFGVVHDAAERYRLVFWFDN